MNRIKSVLKDLVYMIAFCIFLYFNYEIAKELNDTSIIFVNNVLSFVFLLGAFYNMVFTVWDVVVLCRSRAVRLADALEVLEGINNYLDKVKNYIHFYIIKLKWKIVKENENEN